MKRPQKNLIWEGTDGLMGGTEDFLMGGGVDKGPPPILDDSVSIGMNFRYWL